jgi:hypothetical protein
VATLLAVATLLGAGRAAAGTSDRSRFFRLLGDAAEAVEKGKLRKALGLYDRARALAPEHTSPVVGRAVALARDDRMDDFHAVMDEAVRLGLDDPTRLHETPWLRGRLDEEPMQALLRRIEENAASNQRALREAARLPEGDAVPAFDSFAGIEAHFESLEPAARETDWMASSADWWLAERRRAAMEVAILERYLREHAAADDRGDARRRLLDAWIDLAGEYGPIWGASAALGITGAAEACLAEAPDDDERRRARLALAEAALRGVIPETADGPWWQYPEVDGRAAKPLLDAVISEDRDDLWHTRALGLRAVGAVPTCDENPGELRAAYDEWAARPEVGHEESELVDFRMSHELLQARIRARGFPDFDAETLDAEAISLAALKGRVVLLEFWGPG